MDWFILWLQIFVLAFTALIAVQWLLKTLEPSMGDERSEKQKLQEIIDKENILISEADLILERENEILARMRPYLAFIKIRFTRSNGMATQGPVVLNPGQSTVATVLYFDQSGNPMGAGFTPPTVTYAIDNASIASSTPEADGQSDDVAYVSAGVANLTATVQGPTGPLTDTETVTCNAAPQVLSSVKIAFSTPTP